MANRPYLVFALLGLVWFVFCGSQAQAGGFFIHKDTVQFNRDVYAPGKLVRLSFDANSYEYGAGDYEYLYILIAPVGVPTDNLTAHRLRRWFIYALELRRPGSGVGYADPSQSDNHFKLEFNAPTDVGEYQIAYQRVPDFRYDPLTNNIWPGEAMELKGPARLKAEQAILDDPSVSRFARFRVGSEPSPPSGNTVYLQINGKMPPLAKIKGGVTTDPMVLTWKAGPEFKGDSSKLSYRVKVWPVDNIFGPWTRDTAMSLHFLPKGIVNLFVEAKYDSESGPVLFRAAKVILRLDEHLVVEPSTSLAKAGGDKGFEVDSVPVKPTIEFDQVYAKSRALLVGVYEFDDYKSFTILPKTQIGNDISTLQKALELNGFEVTHLVRDRITRDDVATAIEEFVDKAEENDRLLIYFSTHGFPDPKRASDAYLATSDCSYSKPSVHCVRLEDLALQAKRALGDRKVRQVLIAVDSCFSGLGVISKAAPGPNLAALATAPGAYMLTAGMAEQKAWIDPVLKMSTFTHFLAEGLSGGAKLLDKDGVITMTELFLYVQYNVAKSTSSQQIPMLGRLWGDGEMLFRPGVAEVTP